MGDRARKFLLSLANGYETVVVNDVSKDALIDLQNDLIVRPRGIPHNVIFNRGYAAEIGTLIPDADFFVVAPDNNFWRGSLNRSLAAVARKGSNAYVYTELASGTTAREISADFPGTVKVESVSRPFIESQGIIVDSTYFGNLQEIIRVHLAR